MGWEDMLHLAKLLRDREQIPTGLADFIASAIDDTEKAAALAEKDNPMSADQKAKDFTNRLGLTSSKVGRTPKALTWQEAEVERDFGNFPSDRKAWEHVANLGDCSIGTVRHRLKQADEERENEIKEMQNEIERGEWTPD